MNDLQDQFTSIFTEHTDALFRYAFFKLGDREIAKDLVQETFAKTWGYLHKGGDIQQMRAFLYRTLSHLIVDFYRKKKTVSLDVLLEEGFDRMGSGAGEVTDMLDGARVMALLSKLPKKYHDVLFMRFVEGLELEEIAHVTRETKNTVTVRVHRGLKRLKKIFEHEN